MLPFGVVSSSGDPFTIEDQREAVNKMDTNARAPNVAIVARDHERLAVPRLLADAVQLRSRRLLLTCARAPPARLG